MKRAASATRSSSSSPDSRGTPRRTSTGTDISPVASVMRQPAPRRERFSPTARLRPARLIPEEVLVDGHEAVDVVHVAVEPRDDDRVGLVELGPQALDRRRRRGARARCSSAPVCATFAASASPSASASSRATSCGSPLEPSAGCTRLTIRPPNGIRASRSLPRKKIASATGSRSGEVTMRNVVAGSASSALTPAARSRKPSIRPPSGAEEHARSSSRSTPVSRLRIAEDDARAAAHDRRRDARRREEDASARGPRRSPSGGRARRGSPARCATAACRARATSKPPSRSQLVELGDRA